MQRHGWVIGLKEDKITEYKRLHAAVWPEVLRMIAACHFHNYSIFLRKMPDGRHYLFSYLEYTGGDLAADCAKMAAAPVTAQWWAVCQPCQEPLPGLAPGAWWADAEEVFHCD